MRFPFSCLQTILGRSLVSSRLLSAGILENMLEKVLSAFKERVANLVADTTVQSLLADMTVSNKMGAAPSAPLAGPYDAYPL